ncbi:MAG: DUF1700 domain-containing protein [Treponema sp.]|nr:DUF1700 domain-containing protein [Treponema sp.]
MTKDEFLKSLEKRLRALPWTDRRDALEYYEGYLNDAESEAEAMAQLGSPSQVAASILAERAAGGELPMEGSAGRRKGRGVKIAWLIILAIFALPVGLPLTIALASVALALFLALLAIVFAFAVSALAIGLSGLAGIALFPFILAQDAPLALFYGGMGFAALGAGMLLVLLVPFLMKGFPMLARFVAKKIHGRKRGGQKG